ncbi:MAG: helix-turn-helix transcriptional regulator [Patescibacteria group bacterium]|nr:helix-turn-helix transcriptional regulator [Patescibacteria group bacterium]
MSVEALAKLVGLRPTTIYDLERSDSKSSTKLHLFADALGVSVHWLETGKGQRTGGSMARDPDFRDHTPVYGLPISEEEAEMGREWGKLLEPQRSAIAQQIQLLVAAQKRAGLRQVEQPTQKKAASTRTQHKQDN